MGIRAIREKEDRHYLLAEIPGAHFNHNSAEMMSSCYASLTVFGTGLYSLSPQDGKKYITEEGFKKIWHRIYLIMQTLSDDAHMAQLWTKKYISTLC